MVSRNTTSGVPARKGDGWIQAYYDGNGKRRTASGATKSAAKSAADKKIKEGNNGINTDADCRFEDFSKRFMDDSRLGRHGAVPLRFETLRSYQLYIDSRINPIIGNKMLASITNKDMTELMQHCIASTKARRTAQRAFTVAKIILRYAISLDIIGSLPGLTVKIGTDVKDEKVALQERIPSTKQMEALQAAAHARYNSPNGAIKKAYRRYYPLFLILRTTGMRISEALGLKWSDFTADYSRVSIVRRAAPPGKGQSEESRIKTPKSAKGIRMVPVSRELRDVLLVWKVEQETNDNGWLFAVENGNVANYSNINTQFWKPLCKAAGITGFGMHSLRHYFASMLLREGYYKEASGLMGHSSSAFTQDQYGHIQQKDNKLDLIAAMVTDGIKTERKAR